MSKDKRNADESVNDEDSKIKDVAVYDGASWVSIAGADGSAGDPGKDIALTSTQTADPATGVQPVKNELGIETGYGLAGVTLTLNTDQSNTTTNAYDSTWAIPVGLTGAKGETGEPGESLTLKGTVDYETPQTANGIHGTDPNEVTVLKEPASYMGTAGNTLGDLFIVRYQGTADAGGTVPDGNGFVMSLAGSSTPQALVYEWKEIGPIQGTPGIQGEGISLSDVAVDMSSCDITSETASGEFVEFGAVVDNKQPYKLNLTLPRPPKVTKSKSAEAPEVATRCTGDFWIIEKD